MENMQKRRKLFNRVSLLVLVFLVISVMIISGLYNGIFLGIPLNLLVLPFGIIEVGIIGYVYKLILDEEKLEAHTEG
ncbi:MAG: hypothetical protein ABIG96_00510 [Candidatus Micrarchaeota archaeon]